MRSRVIGTPLTTIVVGPSAAIQPINDTVDVWVVKGNGSQPVLMSLPQNPNDGDSFAVEDGAGNAAATPIGVFSLFGTVAGAQPIIGPNQGQVVINSNFGGLQFTFSTFAGGWLVASYQAGGIVLAGNNRAEGVKGTFPAPANGFGAAVMLAVVKAQGSGIFRAMLSVAWHGATPGDTLSWTVQTQTGTGAIGLANAAQFGPASNTSVPGAGAYVSTNVAGGGITFGSGGGSALNQDQKQQDVGTGVLNGEYTWGGILGSGIGGVRESPFPIGNNVWVILFGSAAAHQFGTMSFDNATISLEEV